MNSRIYLMVSFLFKITASLTFTHSVDGQSLTVQCHTATLNDTILFKLDGNTKGGCTSTGTCNTGIDGYQTPTQSGTTITEMVITSCNETTDTGSWTCTYGGPTSDQVTITSCSVVTNTLTDNDNDNGDGKDLGIGIGIPAGCLVIAFIIVIVMVAIRLYILSTEETCCNCFLKFYLFIEEKLFDCCRNINSKIIWFIGYWYLVLFGFIVGLTVLLVLYYGFAGFEEGIVPYVECGILLVLSGLCLLVVWMLKKYFNNDASEKSRSQSLTKNGTVTSHETGKSQKKSTCDKRQQPDGHEGPQSTPKDPDARNLTTGRPLPRRPDIASPQTGPVDSVYSPRLAPIENPSIDTLDEQKTDKKPKNKKKKKKKMKDEEQDNPAYIQDNNVLT